MANPADLLNLQPSTGIIALDWQTHQRELLSRQPDMPQELLKMLESEFHVGYLICYNRLMQALKHKNPATASLITRAMMKELNTYFGNTPS